MALFHSIGVIILAGGKSSRMGQDKGLMPVNEKPMVQFVIDADKKVGTDLILVTNDDRYKQFGHPVIKDEWPEKGPLAGIYTGLKHSAFDYNLVLSCDIPYIHEGVLEFLVESCTGYDITVAESAGKIHPLIGVYRKTCLPVIQQNLQDNNLKVTAIFDKLRVRMLDMIDFLPENFRNIN